MWAMAESRLRVSSEELQEICESASSALGIAGAQVAIAAEGGQILQAAAGVANVEHGTAVTHDTVFQIGSTTKLYTAALVMQLVDQGRIALDTPVASYLPDVTLAADGYWRSITPRHLMSMTSGLDNGPYRETGRGDDCVENYVRGLAEFPMISAPGSAYGYSNASSIVSGLLIERHTGLAWDDALKQHLLDPAGLTESVSIFDELPFFRIATGYRPGPARPGREWTWGRGMAPTGTTLATTARDLARFGRIFLDRGRAKSGRELLSNDAIVAMRSPIVRVPSQMFAQDWCLGPYRKVWGGTELWGHGGTTQNGSSTLLWIPELDLSIAVVVNTPSRGYPFASEVFRAVLAERYGLAMPTRPQVPESDVVDPAPYLGSYRSLGFSYEVTASGRDLIAEMTSTQVLDPTTARPDPPVRTPLRHIAAHRFLPDDDAITRHHGWDIAFGMDETGRAALLHNGGFAAARVPG
jgi:CubicO group peptidase (beta-lactamase class C family)